MIKQQLVLLQENMSNLTSAVSGVASVSYSGTHQQECFSQQNDQSQDQQQAEQPPAKKRRSLPGNPGLILFFFSSIFYKKIELSSF